VDADLLAIVVLVESGGDPAAKSPSGALGLMQILPLTGRHIATERKLEGHKSARLVDPAYNLDFGAWYLSQQLGAFEIADDRARTVDLAAAAYNAGPGKLARFLNAEEKLSSETERYIRWVGGMWRDRRAQTSDTYGAWWRAGGSRLVERAASAMKIDVVAPP
jgi:soluble lytic murein transglycosylase